MTTAAKIFTDQIAGTLSANKEDALEINEIYQFDLAGDDGGTWTVDLRDGPAVTEGANDDATCILKMASEDFVGMMTGELNGMQLFATGKLTVERDVMAAMKLEKLLSIGK